MPTLLVLRGLFSAGTKKRPRTSLDVALVVGWHAGLVPSIGTELVPQLL